LKQKRELEEGLRNLETNKDMHLVKPKYEVTKSRIEKELKEVNQKIEQIEASESENKPQLSFSSLFVFWVV